MENQQKEIFANCSQTHFAMRKFRIPISQCENSPTQIRNAKISQCEISQCQMPFRNAKIDFAMPILNLHCQFQFRNAKISQFQIRNAKISQCEISQCQMPFRNAKFTAFAKFTLRNFQALSSSVINAEPPSIFGVLLLCPIA